MIQVNKPWGYEIIYAATEKYVGKILFIRKGHRLSLQYHKVKDESIYLQSGKLRVIIENDTRELQVGESIRVKPMTVHRFEAIEDSTVLEVSTPELDDVVRLEDDYGR